MVPSYLSYLHEKQPSDLGATAQWALKYNSILLDPIFFSCCIGEQTQGWAS
jgi:hypothetical protein